MISNRLGILTMLLHRWGCKTCQEEKGSNSAKCCSKFLNFTAFVFEIPLLMIFKCVILKA